MPEIHVKYVDGMTFVGKGATNHWVAMDTDDQFGGSEAGTKPMELILVALGGCTGMDIVSILRKKRLSYDKFEIKINGTVAEEYPKYYQRVEIEYLFWGNALEEKDIVRAIELSEQKYCAVMNVIRKSGAEIHTSYKINP